MLVKELIEELQKLDPNLLVIISDQEDNYSPRIIVTKYDFQSYYWDDNNQYAKLPINQEFLKLL